MKPPAVPSTESLRLDALRRYRILDSQSGSSFEDLVAIARLACGTQMSAITLVDVDRQWFKAVRGLDIIQTPRSASMCSHAIRDPNKVMVVEDASADPRFCENPSVVGPPFIRFYAGAPLVTSDGHPLGTICALDARPKVLSSERVEALAAVSRQVMLIIELRRLAGDLESHLSDRSAYERLLSQYHDALLAQHADLTELSRTDTLTGLPNRRAMELALHNAISRAEGSQHQPCVALIDVDHFKSINDLYGHAVGDKVLSEIGSLLRSHMAGRGTAARYGGEEFVVIIENTDPHTARMQCEFLRIAVTELPLGVPISVSIGVAPHRAQDTSGATLERADRAMYAAKAAGRNRVQLALQ